MVTWPKPLVREIAERRVLVFVGSGISKAASPAMPNWSNLLSELKDNLSQATEKKFVSGLIKTGNLLDAAQIISDGLDRAVINDFMRDKFQIRPMIHHEIYRSILELDLKTIVTTNYDEFLEKNFEHFSGGMQAYNVCKHTSSDLLDKLRSPGRTIVKMHGCVTELNDLVLDRFSYFKAKRENSGFFQVLSSLFTINTVLFLGYSLGDPDMQIILEDINMHSDSSHGHYSLVSRQDHKSINRSMKRTYNILCIEYPKGAHDDVPSYLAELATAVGDERAARGIV